MARINIVAVVLAILFGLVVFELTIGAIISDFVEHGKAAEQWCEDHNGSLNHTADVEGQDDGETTLPCVLPNETVVDAWDKVDPP